MSKKRLSRTPSSRPDIPLLVAASGGGGDLPVPIGARHQLPLQKRGPHTHIRHLRCQLL